MEFPIGVLLVVECNGSHMTEKVIDSHAALHVVAQVTASDAIFGYISFCVVDSIYSITKIRYNFYYFTIRYVVSFRCRSTILTRLLGDRSKFFFR